MEVSADPTKTDSVNKSASGSPKVSSYNSSTNESQSGNIRLPPISFISGHQRPQVTVQVKPLSIPKLPMSNSSSPVTESPRLHEHSNSPALTPRNNSEASPRQSSNLDKIEKPNQQLPGISSIQSELPNRSKLGSVFNEPKPNPNITNLLNDNEEPQTRIIIHQHHPTNFNSHKEEPSSANTTNNTFADISHNSPKSKEAPTKVEFKKLKLSVSNLDILDYADKFPPKKLQRLTYRPDGFELPELIESTNSILTVDIPRKYLSVGHNPNLAVRERKVWGTDIYTDDSDIVAILKHCGFVKNEFENNALGKDLKQILGDEKLKMVTPGHGGTEANVLFEGEDGKNQPTMEKKEEAEEQVKSSNDTELQESDSKESKDQMKVVKTAINGNEVTKNQEISNPETTREPEFLTENSNLVLLMGQSDLTVELRVLPPLQKYRGVYRNGINSRSWLTSHDGVSVALYSVKFNDIEYQGIKEGQKTYGLVLQEKKQGLIGTGDNELKRKQNSIDNIEAKRIKA